MFHAACTNCMKLMVTFFFRRCFILAWPSQIWVFLHSGTQIFLKQTESAWCCLCCTSIPHSLPLHLCTNREPNDLKQPVPWTASALNMPRASRPVSVPLPAPTPFLALCHTPAPDISTCSNAVPRLEMQDSSCIQKPSQTIFRSVVKSVQSAITNYKET